MATINFLGFMPIEQIKASGITFDYALPQLWVNDVRQKLDHVLNREDNIAAHFVMVYPEGSVFGGIMPIDADGVNIIRMLSEI